MFVREPISNVQVVVQPETAQGITKNPCTSCYAGDGGEGGEKVTKETRRRGQRGWKADSSQLVREKQGHIMFGRSGCAEGREHDKGHADRKKKEQKAISL